MTFGLEQGKTIQEVEAYVPNITAAVVNAVRVCISIYLLLDLTAQLNLP